MKIKFTFLTGDMNWADYGAKWISQKFNNGEFDWWFVREIHRWGEHEEPETGKYNVSLSVVAPSQISEDERRGILSSCGHEEGKAWDEYTPEQLVDIAHSYGTKANVFDANGNNYSKLFKDAAKAAMECEFFFGFKMDAPQNLIGSTGWDFLKGDSLAGLRRYQESGETGDTAKDIMTTMENASKKEVPNGS